MTIPYRVLTPRKTSQEWWEEMKQNRERFNNWLCRQAVCEGEASKRITELRDKYAADDEVAHFLLTRIIADEETHAQWMYEIARLYMPEVQHIPESGRYWDEVEATESMDEDNLQYACAIAAHAETMRLERITCIATDDAFGSANPLLQKYFKQILKDESFHAKAFARLAGEEAMERAKANHHRGMEALGLVI